MPPARFPDPPLRKHTGLFAGLTLGFLSMDKIGLEIVMEAGDPVSRRCAKVLLSLVGGFWGDVCVYRLRAC